jgi:hypothetical protein
MYTIFKNDFYVVHPLRLLLNFDLGFDTRLTRMIEKERSVTESL